MNTAKYRIVGEFEQRLPASPYWPAEWKLLGEGNDKNLYWPLTDIGNIVPIVVANLYFVGVVIFAFL